MCGICGELSLERGGRVSAAALAAMAARLAHRGPDHEAVFVSPDGRAGLGFRRLSVIDLSLAARQPMPNEDGAVHLVFNGEIYNYRELRTPLAARGHVFRSQADSEVIVHLYEERGEAFVDELDGMFAIALWDGRAGRLVLARDRAGKKPLYVWRDAARLVFASEIKAIAAHPAVRVEMDGRAVPDYFRYGYVPHPRTFYRDVVQVEPGTIETIDLDGRRTARRYWRIAFPEDAGLRGRVDVREAAQRVRELVTAAVARRLVSDVPIGAFLSGGLDSTIVAGVMSRLAGEPVRTFSLGFEGDPAFDETAIAEETAARLGTRHTAFRVRPDAVALLDTLVYHHDGPFGDSSAIPTYLVARLARAHVTVALTGDGGDELFAGYLRFGAALAAERVPRWAAAAAAGVLDRLPAPRHERHWLARARRFARHARRPLEDRLAAWTAVFGDDVEALLGTGPPAAGGHPPASRPDGLARASPLARLLALNFEGYLHDDLLVKLDRMTMANALEARSPFLDRTLAEYAATLPDALKLRGATTKVVLREAFADLIPPAVARGGKRGFGVPLDEWFRGGLAPFVRDTLLAPSARLRDHVSQAYVRRLVEEHAAGWANHGHRLWALVTFERWLHLLPSWIAPRRS